VIKFFIILIIFFGSFNISYGQDPKLWFPLSQFDKDIPIEKSTKNFIEDGEKSTMLLDNESCNDENTKILLHFNSDLTDEALGGGHTWSAHGNASINASIKKFGAGSLYLDGNGDFIDTIDSSDFDVASGDFTIDFWFYPTNLSHKSSFWSQMVNSGSPYKTSINITANYPYDGSISLFADSDGTTPYWDLISGDPAGTGEGTANLLSTSTWHHIAFVRNGDNWRSYIDGVHDVDVTLSGSIYNSDENLNIGKLFYEDYAYVLGYVDEFRFSRSVLWSSDFTPPVSECNNDTSASISTSSISYLEMSGIKGILSLNLLLSIIMVIGVGMILIKINI
jgi:hypothetical protein